MASCVLYYNLIIYRHTGCMYEITIIERLSIKTLLLVLKCTQRLKPYQLKKKGSLKSESTMRAMFRL